MKRHLTLLLLLLSLFVAWRTARTQAAPFVTTIRVPADQPNIKAALNAAQAGDTIELAPGTYTGVDNREINVNKAVTIRCRTGLPADCIVDALQAGKAVFYFRTANLAPVLEGITVKNGVGFFYDAGGIVISNGARPLIRDCIITNNIAVNSNGGALVENASPEFRNCVITNNLGLGMKVTGTSNVTISGCTFSGNFGRAGLRIGGEASGVINEALGKPSANVSNCRFENNEGTGLDLSTTLPDSQPSAVVTGSVFTGNGNSGVQAFGADTLSLTNCALLFNTGIAPSTGGLHASFTFKVTLTNSLVVGNRVVERVAQPGVIDSPASAVTLLLVNDASVANCTITGHAISTLPTLFFAPTQNPALVNVPFRVINSIFWGNTSTKDILSGTAPGYPVVTVSACDTQNGMEGIADGGGNLSVNPLFVRNALTNGATDAGDLRLQNTSPVKDRGTLTGVNLNTFVKDANDNPLDYALAPRLSCEGQIDLGAYENQTVTGTLFTPGTPTANGTLGASYSGSVAATPAAPAGFSYRYSLANGTMLPGGLLLDTSTGAITGTPNASGVFNFDLKVELLNPSNNPTACSNTQRRTITICPNLSVTPGTSPSIIRGVTSASLAYTATGNPNRYSIDYDATANAAGFVDVTNAVLPTSPITLTVPAAAALGTYNATLTVGDSATNCASATAAFTVTLLPCPTGFTVNTTADTQDAAPGNGACADANGNCSLRAALSEANALKAQTACTGNLTITLPAGTFTQTLLAAQEDANAGGDWDISANVTIAGVGSTIVQAATTPNTASERVWHVVSGTVEIRDLTVRYGKDANGGGFFNAGNMTLQRVLIDQNIGGSSGGGLFNESGRLTLNNITFSGNSASFDGGGMYNNFSSNSTLSNVTFSGNSAGRGGGMFNNNSNPTVTNVTFNNNSATNIGGGMHNIGNSNPALRNCILWGDGGGELVNDGASATVSDSIVQGGYGGGTNIITADPLLVPLGNYNGTTPTHALLPGSSAINAGTSSGAPATDQRGIARDSNVDIGAFESRGFTLTLAGGSPQATPIFAAFPAPLAVQVSSAFNEPVQGGQVTFTAPTPPGASATLATSPATIGAFNQASVNATANGTLGSYQVTANANGAAPAVNFALTNVCPLITVNAPATTTGAAGVAFNQSFTQTGGLGLTTFSTASTLPNGLTLAPNGVLSGTPLQTGTFPLVVSATDANLCTGTTSYTLVIGCPMLSLAALPQATAGTLFSTTLSASPGGGSYQFGSANLPTWLTLAANGSLSGVPPTAGTFSFNVSVTGFGSCTQSLPVTLTVVCPVITVAPSSLPAATINTAYPQVFTASPAGGNYSFAVTSGLLPAGLTLNSNGTFSGAPTQSGTFNFRVTATGFGTCGAFADYVLLVNCPGVSLSPASLPGGTLGTAYSQSVAASPAGTYSYSVTSGALPGGLTLNPATGLLGGTPTAPGTFSFTVTAAANGCTGSRSYTVVIGCAGVSFTTTSLPNAQAGVGYSQMLGVSPAGAYSFSVLTGSLPPGLTLNTTTGNLSGTPTATGSYGFTVQALGAGGCGAAQAYTLAVTCPTVTLNPTSLPNGTTGTAYTQTLSASPTSSYSFSKTAGTLPPGLNLSAAGVLSGTPTTAGTYTFTVAATGFGTCVGSQAYTVTLSTSCTTITLPALPATGTVGVNYTGNLAATTPSAAYTFTVDSGAPPPGLVIDNLFGMLSGKPTAAGTYNFTLKATRGNGCTGTRAYTVVVSGGALVALARTADYDGDGKSDLSLWSASNGRWQILRSSDEQPQTPAWGGAGDVTLLGDYDGDGQTDLAVFRPANGTWYIQRSSDGSALVKTWGSATDVPVPGDYDGDGKTDVAIFRPSEGNWYILKSSDGSYLIKAWGLGVAPYLDVPVPGDYDGDGKTDLAVFRRSAGTWLIQRSSDGQYTSKAWGGAADIPVVGDYDGDGKTDLAIWRGATGEWFVLRSSDGGYDVTAWGALAAGDVPAPGDYDGDRRNDLAVWRATEATWYVRRTVDAVVFVKAQSPASAWPVAGRLR